MQKNSNIRVVIPAYKAKATLKQCVEAVISSLSFSDHWEIYVIDNGDNGAVETLISALPIHLLKRSDFKSAAYARNEGAKDFAEGILVFIDSDVIVQKDCIQQLIQPVLENKCQATIGNYSKDLRGLSFTQKYKQLYIHHIYNRKGEEIKNDFWTAICCVDAAVFHQLKGLNAAFKGANGEDQEFGIRLTKNGFVTRSVKLANGQHLNPYTFSGVIKNDFRKGVMAFRNSVENGVALSDNRHARMIDILSVICAFWMLLLVPMLFWNNLWLQVILFVFISWLGCRLKLIFSLFRAEGLLFLTRALFFMYLLDLIRACCVIKGAGLILSEKKSIADKAQEKSLQLNT